MGRIAMSGDPRCERMGVLMTTTAKQNLTKVAMVQRTSINQIINTLIDQYLEEHQNDIQRYNDFFGEE